MTKKHETTAGELIDEVVAIYDEYIAPHDSVVPAESEEVKRKIAEVMNCTDQMAVLTDLIWDAAQYARVNASEKKTEVEDEINATPLSIDVRRFLRSQIKIFHEKVVDAAERWNLGPQ